MCTCVCERGFVTYLCTGSLLTKPIPEELQNGDGFGYIVMFRPVGVVAWTVEKEPSVEASKFVYRNQSLNPLSPFEVKVGVYNQEGEGPWSAVCIIHSGEDGELPCFQKLPK